MAVIRATTWALDPGASRWGHHAPKLLVAVIVATVVLVFRPVPYDSPLVVVTPVALVALALTSWVQLRQHDRRLCELCLAAMPLNASESAQRYRRRLALVHLATRRWPVAGYLALIVAANVLLAVAPPALAAPATLTWAAVQSTLVYVVLAHTTHRRLQPWCAQCSDGEGRRPVDLPDPRPAGSRSW